MNDFSCVIIFYTHGSFLYYIFLHALVLVFVSACMFRLDQTGGVLQPSAIAQEAQTRT